LNKGTKMFTPMFVYLVIGITVMALVCVKRIPEGQAYTLRRLGGHLRTIGAGTHLVLPGIERITHRIRLLGNVVRIEHLPVEPAARICDGSVYFQVLDAERADAVIDRFDTLVRGCLSELVVDTAGEDSTARNSRIKAELNRALGDRGILITRVQLSLA